MMSRTLGLFMVLGGSLGLLLVACGSSGDPGPARVSGTVVEDGGAKSEAAAQVGLEAGSSVNDGALDSGLAPMCPSTGTWSSLIPGPGQNGHHAGLAALVGKYDRLHDALITRATGLAGSVVVSSDASTRQKLANLLTTPWKANDADPTDDLLEYESLDPANVVTSWGSAAGMYAGSEMAADAFRYAVLRDRGGSCNDVARARKMVRVGLDAFHVLVSIPGVPGSIPRAIARNDLPGDGQSVVTPLFDGNNQPLPTEKNNGTWRADNSAGGKYANLVWLDSCSRDMLFGWTFGVASLWEVIANDPSFDAQTKARLQADAKLVLDGLMKVRPSGKDLELWDPDGRRTYHGNLHETSVDRNYVVTNGPASMMALGEVAGLVSVVDDAPAKTFLQALVGSRGLPTATGQSMFVVALGGDSSNHSAFNMLFMTGWMARRYVDDATARSALRKPIEQDLYSPLFGAKPAEWKQSFFDLVVAASTGEAWKGSHAKPSFDAQAAARAVETLAQFPEAPFYPAQVENCDAAEIAASSCVLNDGVTSVSLKSTKWGLVGDKPVPMKVRPPSNFYWRTDPYIVNGIGDPNVIFPGSDLRMAYWLGRYVRVQ